MRVGYRVLIISVAAAALGRGNNDVGQSEMSCHDTHETIIRRRNQKSIYWHAPAAPGMAQSRKVKANQGRVAYLVAIVWYIGKLLLAAALATLSMRLF